MQTLGMEPQASSSWCGSVPHPSGGEEHPRRGRAAPLRKKGAQGCFQRRCWHKEQALGQSMTLRPGKTPLLSSCPAWGRGDGAAAAGPGMGRVSEGSPGWPGPAEFRVTCKAQSEHMPSLPHGMEASWAPLHLPRPANPWEGEHGSPTLMAAAQLAGDSALQPPTPFITQWCQLEGHPAPGCKIPFLVASTFGRAG